GPVSLHFDHAQLVIRILEEQPLRTPQPAEIKSNAHCASERHFGSDHQQTSIPLLCRLPRAHLDVEQMLPSPLPPVRDALIASARALRFASHSTLLPVLARDSSMMRTQRSG